MMSLIGRDRPKGDRMETEFAGRSRCSLERRVRGDGDAGHQTGNGSHDAGNAPFSTSRELEHAVLHLLASNDGPLGSGTLMERLQDLGYSGSEPTVGRFLRSLDRRSLTVRVSNRGRELTDAGRSHLRQLCEAESRRFYERELIQTIRTTTIDDILDVLVARRALERETARLAAERATPEEIAQMEDAIRQQRAALAMDGVAVTADERFHRLIAQASHNRVLAAAVDLIRRDEQIALLIDSILKQTTHKWVVGHDKILAAIMARSADEAERAMIEHINSLIDDLRRYQSRRGTGQGGESLAGVLDALAAPRQRKRKVSAAPVTD